MITSYNSICSYITLMMLLVLSVDTYPCYSYYFSASFHSFFFILFRCVSLAFDSFRIKVLSSEFDASSSSSLVVITDLFSIFFLSLLLSFVIFRIVLTTWKPFQWFIFYSLNLIWRCCFIFFSHLRERIKNEILVIPPKILSTSRFWITSIFNGIKTKLT